MKILKKVLIHKKKKKIKLQVSRAWIFCPQVKGFWNRVKDAPTSIPTHHMSQSLSDFNKLPNCFWMHYWRRSNPETSFLWEHRFQYSKISTYSVTLQKFHIDQPSNICVLIKFDWHLSSLTNKYFIRLIVCIIL